MTSDSSFRYRNRLHRIDRTQDGTPKKAEKNGTEKLKNKNATFFENGTDTFFKSRIVIVFYILLEITGIKGILLIL